MAFPKASDTVQTSLLAVTQTAMGCAVGLLLAGKLGRSKQKITAASLFSVALLFALPALTGSIGRVWNRPTTSRGMRRRLGAIRRDAGVADEIEVF